MLPLGKSAGMQSEKLKDICEGGAFATVCRAAPPFLTFGLFLSTVFSCLLFAGDGVEFVPDVTLFASSLFRVGIVIPSLSLSFLTLVG